jgi:hypothetical protein
MSKRHAVALQMIVDCEVAQIAFHLVQTAQEGQILSRILNLKGLPDIITF